MVHSSTKVASLLALLCTPTFSISIPQQLGRPEVPWKRNGIVDYVEERNRRRWGDDCEHGPESRGCWSGHFSVDTDMDLEWPDTGKTVRYDLEITEQNLAPDGFERPMMVINGQYPGPVIVADWGDDIEISVTNHLETNGTSIHWHGLRQLNSNQMDGVNGITECPIAPGATKVYRFKATQYGTSWYHSHYSVQYGDGLVGGIQINGPATADYDIDLGIMPFTDWFHTPMFTVNAAAMHAKGPPIADNVLVNGSMTSPAGGDYGSTVLTPGKKHRIRFVNTGINNHINLALDGHEFTVIAADFVPIVPYTTRTLSLAIGQRYDAIIDATATTGNGNYWLRVGTGGGKCDGPNANDVNIGSIFHYDRGADALPDSEADGDLPTGCGDETNIVPHVKTQVPQELPEEMTLGFTSTAASSNLVQWMINGKAMLIDFKSPTLQKIEDGVQDFDAVENVFVVGEAHKFQYWVIQSDNSTPPIPHAIHLHGHDFYILDFAENAVWSGDVSRLKTDNPIRRDTATLPAHGYLVLAFESDNPGVWLMHCHIPFHVAAGFGVQFVERRDEIADSIGDVSGMKEGCESWDVWQGDRETVLDLGDSGLR